MLVPNAVTPIVRQYSTDNQKTKPINYQPARDTSYFGDRKGMAGRSKSNDLVFSDHSDLNNIYRYLMRLIVSKHIQLDN